MHPLTTRATRIVARARERLASEESGFTLIELLNVMLIMAILMSISFSSYTTLQAHAQQKSAVANLSAIKPYIAEWRQDYGSYAGINMILLNSTYMNNSIDITYFTIKPEDILGTTFCAQYTTPTGNYVAKLDQTGTINVGGPSNVCA